MLFVFSWCLGVLVVKNRPFSGATDRSLSVKWDRCCAVRCLSRFAATPGFSQGESRARHSLLARRRGFVSRHGPLGRTAAEWRARLPRLPPQTNRLSLNRRLDDATLDPTRQKPFDGTPSRSADWLAWKNSREQSQRIAPPYATPPRPQKNTLGAQLEFRMSRRQHVDG